jgi:hypothetical protein
MSYLAIPLALRLAAARVLLDEAEHNRRRRPRTRARMVLQAEAIMKDVVAEALLVVCASPIREPDR